MSAITRHDFEEMRRQFNCRVALELKLGVEGSPNQLLVTFFGKQDLGGAARQIIRGRPVKFMSEMEVGKLEQIGDSGLEETFRTILLERGLEILNGTFADDRYGREHHVLTVADNKPGKRWAALMPNMSPRYVRIYDNGGVDNGGSIDRYCAVMTGKAGTAAGSRGTEYPYLAFNSRPFHGYGQHGWSDRRPVDVNERGWPPKIGQRNHLGERIRFEDLPTRDARKFVFDEYLAIWKL